MKRKWVLWNISLLTGVFFLVICFTGCSDDDEDILNDPQIQASITVNKQDKIISRNTPVIDLVNANTDVWLIARHTDATGEILGKVLLPAGNRHEVSIPLQGTFLEDGDIVLLMLYVDDKMGMGDSIFEEGSDDVPIFGATETIVVRSPGFTISNVNVNNRTVVFDNVTVANRGWIVLYNGNPGILSSPIVGYTLVDGSTDNVEVILNDNFSEEDPLFARLHVESEGNREFTYGDYWYGATDPPEFFGFEEDNTIWMELSPGASNDDTAYTFNWYDLDNDGVLNLAEALSTFNAPNYFMNYWDLNQDGSLNKEEFYLSFFINSDSNLDNVVSKDEFELGNNSLYSGHLEPTFAIIDQDENNMLDKEEWSDAFYNTGWFEAYDSNRNNLVSINEWQTGLLLDWDTNDNLKIEENEFNNYITYVFSWLRW